MVVDVVCCSYVGGWCLGCFGVCVGGVVVFSVFVVWVLFVCLAVFWVDIWCSRLSFLVWVVFYVNVFVLGGGVGLALSLCGLVVVIRSSFCCDLVTFFWVRLFFECCLWVRNGDAGCSVLWVVALCVGVVVCGGCGWGVFLCCGWGLVWVWFVVVCFFVFCACGGFGALLGYCCVCVLFLFGLVLLSLFLLLVFCVFGGGVSFYWFAFGGLWFCRGCGRFWLFFVGGLGFCVGLFALFFWCRGCGFLVIGCGVFVFFMGFCCCVFWGASWWGFWLGGWLVVILRCQVYIFVLGVSGVLGWGLIRGFGESSMFCCYGVVCTRCFVRFVMEIFCGL